MNSLIFNLPVWLQNFLISVYGLRIQRIRYGGNYQKYKRDISRNPYLSREELQEYQFRMLKTTIESARKNVPYYHALFSNLGLSGADLKSMEDIHRIPFLEKELLRREPSQFIHKKYAGKNTITVHTSGTTGTPLNIYCDPDVRRMNYAYFDRFLEQAGIRYQGCRATFGGRLVVQTSQKTPPFWRYSSFQKNLLFSTYHLTDKNIPYYIEKLKQFRPDYIDAYPTALYVLAKFAHDNRIDLKNTTEAITTSAETLLPGQRSVIEEVFAVPVFDQLGSAEMCVFIAQCSEGRYHLHSDYSYVELINSNGEPARAGETGEMVCTGFINPVMPLIRYRIGDLAVLSDQSCSCGMNFPVLAEIAGRKDDIIITPDGRKIGRIGRVFYDFPVKEVQYIQRQKERVEVYLVKDLEFTQDHERKALQELRKRLGTEIAIQFNYVDSIERSKNGKLKTIISYIRDQEKL